MKESINDEIKELDFNTMLRNTYESLNVDF